MGFTAFKMCFHSRPLSHFSGEGPALWSVSMLRNRFRIAYRSV